MPYDRFYLYGFHVDDRMPENVDVSKPGKFRAPALLVLIAACVAVAAFLNVVNLGIVSYVHIFYVPAIIAGLWYGRKSIGIVVPLGPLEILLSFLNAGQITPAAFMDGFLLIVVASVVGVLSEYRDQLNDRLTYSLAVYQEIFDAASDAIVVQDMTTGNVLDSNEAWTRLSGYSREESRSLSPSLLGTGETGFTAADMGEYLRKAEKEGPQLFEWQILRKDGGRAWVEVNLKKVTLASDIRVLAIVRDISERKKTDDILRLEEQRLGALLLLNQMTEASLQEITDFALEEGVRLTRSKIGYLAFMSDDETLLTMHSWSKDAMGECAVRDVTINYPVASTGLWGEAVRQRRPIITNDYAGLSHWKKGLPPGHVQICRHMNVPVFEGGRIVAVAGAGNKDDDYDETDVRELTLLMQGMWRLIQRKRDLAALRESETKFRVLAETTPSIILIMQGEKLIYANPAAEKAMGYTREELMGMSPAESAALITDGHHSVDSRGDLREKLRDGESIRYEIMVKTRSGEERWLDVTASLLQYHESSAVLVTGFDVTDRRIAEEKVRASLHEKDVLLKEIHHRVKNNLQVVSSMLSLQSMSQSDSATVCLLRESQDRVRSMALIHEQFYQASDLSRIDFGEYTETLTANLLRSYTAGGTIKLNIDVRDILMSIDLAIPCGLIISELVTNSLKYAFPDGRAGTITVSMHREGMAYVLVLKDDGVGMPRQVDYRNAESFGLQLVDTLVGQIEGSIVLAGEGGTGYTIRFTDRN